MITISDSDLKKELLSMHQRGYNEGLEDLKKATIETLESVQLVQKDNLFSIQELINFIKKIDVTK